MKFKWEKKHLSWGITGFLVIVLSILFFLMLYRFDYVINAFKFIINLLMPFIIAFVIAYLLIPVSDFFENKLLIPLFNKRKNRKDSRLPRVFSIIITIVLALALVIGLIVMVVPQLLESIKKTIDDLPIYFNNLETWLTDLFSSHKDLESSMSHQLDSLNKFINDWTKNNLLPQVNNFLTGLTSGVMGFFNTLLNIFVGIVVAIYIMYSKETFIAQTKKIIYAFFTCKTANRFIRVIRRADHVFGSFIKGKLIDSMIIGILCFIGMSSFRMPFALLISVIVGVFNVIPFFGPFIGAIPSAILILMVDPLKSLYFIIFIIVLQQFDGNVLGPKILGNSTGLSAFWVIFSIMVFGGLFGFVGMIIGVPTFALIYSFISDVLESRLKKQQLPVKTESYYKLDFIKDINNEPVYSDETNETKK